MQGHSSRARGSRMHRIKVGLGAALLAAFLAGLTATASGAAGVVHAYTIGGPGHASMYASGLDVDPSGNIYIATPGTTRWPRTAPGSSAWRQLR